MIKFVLVYASALWFGFLRMMPGKLEQFKSVMEMSPTESFNDTNSF